MALIINPTKPPGATSAHRSEAVVRIKSEIRVRESNLAAKEEAQLAACKTPEARAELKAEITKVRAQRAESLAVAICSEETWTPKTNAQSAGHVLTGFYRAIGLKARQIATSRGEAFGLKHIEEVQAKLTPEEVKALSAPISGLGAPERKLTMKLLHRHVFHARFLTSDALRYIQTAVFLLAFGQIQLDAFEDRQERRQQDEKISVERQQVEHDRLRTTERKRAVTPEFATKMVTQSSTTVGSGQPISHQTFVKLGDGSLVPHAEHDE